MNGQTLQHAPVRPLEGRSATIAPISMPDALRDVRASLLADETATLALVVAGLRSLRGELERAATIDALGTPASYRLATELLDTLTGDLEGLLDGREFADVDRRAA